jgi:hypothetical protein
VRVSKGVNHPGSRGRGGWAFSGTGSGAYVACFAKARDDWMNLTRASRPCRESWGWTVCLMHHGGDGGVHRVEGILQEYGLWFGGWCCRRGRWLTLMARSVLRILRKSRARSWPG